ncbi:unnamed protein product [Acanthoscelides obtectus]|uniref:PiggyBac transposable element-derived protein domain-containing protein n=1 Tax=Acanthoscelides obtectus TaxID=200917 RepID=A0A9P0P7B3_ACAOB|nr:unnamed protein product [Acanthoscelides obtectus]CAK1638621.1 PiggyBac transposable element-derived protein 3 [Acanthoscelides obtectus]
MDFIDKEGLKGILQKGMTVEAIYIAPPEPAVLTDEDCGDEDEVGDLDHLSKRQLLAEAEVRFAGGVTLEDTHPEHTDSNGNGSSSKEGSTPADMVYPQTSDTREWISGDFTYNKRPFPEAHYSPFKNKSVVHIFEMFIDNDVILFLVQETNKYTLFKNLPDPRVSQEEMKCFIGILLISGYNDLPKEDLSFRESMVKYYGKHSCKQFSSGKPIRFRYKVWCLNTTMGYLVDFEIYQGKSVTPDSVIERNFGKAAAPLVKMLEGLPDNIKSFPISFYFDNLFTSFSLLSYLCLKGYGGTGTMRDNRIPKGCLLLDKKHLQKREKGYFENVISRTDGVLVAKWVDNSVVSIATNKYGVTPATNVKRYSQKEKKHIQVE